MKSKCSEFIWVQKDGTPIHVRRMSDHHLLCTIRLLRRWGDKIARKYNEEEGGTIWEAAEDAGFYWFEGHEFTDGHPTWAALQLERRMRGLEELPAEETK